MLSKDLESDEYTCLCGLHSHTGALIFLLLAFLVSIANIARGIIKQDDFYTVGFLLDLGIIILALIGNRFNSKSLYYPFFVFHVILIFSLSVIGVLLFIRLYERNQMRRNTLYTPLFINQDFYDYSGSLFLVYTIILLIHAYAIKVIYRSYLYMRELKKSSKTDIHALKILVDRERRMILARANANKSLLPSPIDV